MAALKKVEAIIRPSALEDVNHALCEAGGQGLTVSDVKGYGRQKGHTETHSGTEYIVEFQPKVRVEIVITDDRVEDMVKAICSAAQTGNIGDGKIFVIPVDDAIRVRTRENGDVSIQ
jgi:nitrogen regulatory protein P-II 1